MIIRNKPQISKLCKVSTFSRKKAPANLGLWKVWLLRSAIKWEEVSIKRKLYILQQDVRIDGLKRFQKSVRQHSFTSLKMKNRKTFISQERTQHLGHSVHRKELLLWIQASRQVKASEAMLQGVLTNALIYCKSLRVMHKPLILWKCRIQEVWSNGEFFLDVKRTWAIR